MSFLNKIMGHKSKAPRTPSLPEAIKRLKATEEMLQKKQNSLEEKINKEISVAKKNVSTNKKVALQAIQKKKRLERQLQHVDGALTKLEAQREVLESANINRMVVSSMDQTSKALKATHKNLDVDKVDKILDDLADQRDISEEISEAISRPVSFQDDIDEDELERELAELENDLENLDIEKKLPTVPQNNISEKQKENVVISTKEEKKKPKEAMVTS